MNVSRNSTRTFRDARGLVYVAFGEEYSRMAAATILYSRQFTDLPVHVLTNVEPLDAKWGKIKNITFEVLKIEQNNNRLVKTSLPKYTPFRQSLYLDCDSVIQKLGIEGIFDLLGDYDLLLNLFLRWKKGDKILRLYRTAMQKADVSLPLDVYNGALIAWNSWSTVNSFFCEWQHLWTLNGMGREMPALACAVKRCKCVRIKTVEERTHKIISPDLKNVDCIVQHNYSKDFYEKFDVPIIRQNKPFDVDTKDWNWVEAE